MAESTFAERVAAREARILMGMRTARQVVTGLGLSVAGQTMEEFRGSAT